MEIKTALELVLKDKERKSIPRIIKEGVHSAFIEKELPIHYFSNFLYKKTAPDYRNFIGYKTLVAISRGYYNVGNIDSIENKLLFENILSKNNVETTNNLGHNNGRVLYSGDTETTIENNKDLVDLINNFVRKSSNGSIFVKPLDGIGGANSFKFIGSQQYNKKIDQLYTLLEKQSFVFQETIDQHKEINRIYNKSINTVRIHTFKDSVNGQVELVSALMRFGSHGSEIDNGTSGGFFIPIDLNNWKLSGKGITYFKNGGYFYERHPDTNVLLDGIQIPYGGDIENEVRKAASLFDKEFIGWDVAITPSGPLIVEGVKGSYIM